MKPTNDEPKMIFAHDGKNWRNPDDERRRAEADTKRMKKKQENKERW